MPESANKTLWIRAARYCVQHGREVGRRAGHERVRMAFCTFAMLDQRSWRVWSASAYCWTRSPKSGRRKMSMVISDSLIWKVCAYHAMKRSNDAFSETNVDICTAEVMRKRFSLLVRNLSGTRARAGVRCAASQGEFERDLAHDWSSANSFCN